jgi:hypothetical protein
MERQYEMYLRETGCKKMDWIHLAQGPMAGFDEHIGKLLGCIKASTSGTS